MRRNQSNVIVLTIIAAGLVLSSSDAQAGSCPAIGSVVVMGDCSPRSNVCYKINVRYYFMHGSKKGYGGGWYHLVGSQWVYEGKAEFLC